MGKKSKRIRNIQNFDLPRVSICTPTYNRRSFIPNVIACFNHQTYPKELIEWVIVDDGTDKIEDLVCDIPQVKYFKYNEKLVLGKKRNITNSKASGDIIIYMDDDDYYPPTRISYAVNMLLTHPDVLCAGGTEQYIYYKHNKTICLLGPYGKNHGTAGTFAFKRELLKITQFQDNASSAEEKFFLKNFTIPFIQLSPMHTSLMFSHGENTFDKKILFDKSNPKCRKTSYTIRKFIKSKPMAKLFLQEVDMSLSKGEPNSPAVPAGDSAPEEAEEAGRSRRQRRRRRRRQRRRRRRRQRRRRKKRRRRHRKKRRRQRRHRRRRQRRRQRRRRRRRQRRRRRRRQRRRRKRRQEETPEEEEEAEETPEEEEEAEETPEEEAEETPEEEEDAEEQEEAGGVAGRRGGGDAGRRGGRGAGG